MGVAGPVIEAVQAELDAVGDQAVELRELDLRKLTKRGSRRD